MSRTARRLLLTGSRRFSPLSLRPQVWLDPSAPLSVYQNAALTTPAIADNDPILGWKDFSGNGNHATQATSGNAAALKLGVQNGRNVVLFNGTSSFLQFPDFCSSWTEGSVYWVIRSPAVQTGLGIFNGLIGSNGDWYPYTDNGSYNLFLGFGSNTRYAFTTTLDISQWNVLTFNTSASAWSCYLNSDNLYSTGTNTVSFPTTPLIGKNCEGIYGNFYAGEFLMFNRILPAGEDAWLRKYLKTKWGTP